MQINKIFTTITLFASISLFSQISIENTEIQKTEIEKTEAKLSYLDSIKKTFVNHKIAATVDSLWMKELNASDLYQDLSKAIETVNIDQTVDYELPTDLLKKRLADMDAKSPFNIEYNQGLENIIKSFLKNRKKAFERLMGISEYYFPLFEEALARKNVPLEIKYLAVVESALNPKAISRAGATGLWQFMYHTGKQYNLKIDSYIDERSDPLKSSQAAAQYMSNMYAIFNDWDLVLASYNSGPGNVTKAIRRSGGQQNFWNIRKKLPQETQGYVPAFLATMYIYEYHKEHGIKPSRAVIPHFGTDTIGIKKQLSFKQISELLDVPVAQLQLLNPSYKINTVPFYEGQMHYLRLPVNKIALFASNEDKVYAYAQHELDLREKPFQAPKVLVVKDSLNHTEDKAVAENTKYHIVKKGENLEAIAQKYNASVEDVKKWNNLKSNHISRNRRLKMILNEVNVAKENQTLAVKEAKNIEDKSKKDIKTELASVNTASYYVVQKGDNLSNIAKRYNITMQELKELNSITNNSIQLGTSLQVSKIEAKPIAVAAENIKIENIEYLVQKGDNLGNIAKKFGSTIENLKEWNGLVDNNITLGKNLIVAKNEIKVEAKSEEMTIKKNSSLAALTKKNTADYYVQKGDSLYSISKKYPGVSVSDIKKWNNIRSEDLKPGMKLKINGDI